MTDRFLSSCSPHNRPVVGVVFVDFTPHHKVLSMRVVTVVDHSNGTLISLIIHVKKYSKKTHQEVLSIFQPVFHPTYPRLSDW